jgi:hypothetical protein
MEEKVSPYPTIGDSYLAPTGEPYIIMVLGGIKPEGKQYPLMASDLDNLAGRFLDNYDAYIEYKPLRSTLYWRDTPTVRRILDEDGFPWYTLRARFLLSDKPILNEDTNL